MAIPYEIRLSPRRRTVAIEVHRDLRVIVRAPAGFDPATLTARVAERERWIRRQVERFRACQPLQPPRQFLTGETHFYLGRPYRLRVERGARTTVGIAWGELLVQVRGEASTNRVRRALEGWYRDRAHEVFGRLVAQRFEAFRAQGFACPSLGIRRMATRWGSLAAGRRMTLNLALIRTPEPCIEYVVVHELCHLRHRGHGPRFHGLLESLMPDWRERKAQLEAAVL